MSMDSVAHSSLRKSLMESEKIQLKTLSSHVTSLINSPQFGSSLTLKPQIGEWHDQMADALTSIKGHMEEVISRRNIEADMQNAEYYLTAMDTLKEDFQRIYCAVQSQFASETFSSYLSLFHWLNVDNEELWKVFTEATSQSRVVRYCACLCLTAIFERSLQDLHLMLFDHTHTMLKELIHSEQLKSVLGEDLIAFLDIVVGPPTSLNIRNLVWHGFGSTDPAESVEQYSVIMIYIMYWVGTILDDKGIKVCHRPHLQLKACTASLISTHPCLTETIQDFDVGLLPGWAKPQDISQCLQYAYAGEYGRAVCLLLVTFEHVIRVVFCVYNGCQSRQMTAVQSEYFTTLDHVFEERMSDSETDNKLYKSLPPTLRTALSDLLFYPDGLRLRDRLSHMELSYLDIDETVWTYTYNVLISTMKHVVDIDRPTDVDRYLLTSYTPVFHPLSILFGSVAQCQCEIQHLDDATVPGSLKEDTKAEVPMHVSALLILKEKFQPSLDSHCQPSLDLFGYLFDAELCQSNKFKSVAEWCKLLQSIVENLQTSAVTLAKFHKMRSVMVEEKSLRSRQRKNYMTFLKMRPSFVAILRALLEVAMELRQHMVQPKLAVVGKDHKFLLQLTENLYSHYNDCKWSQSLEYFDSFVKTKFDK